jgi:hypothetical protein
MHSSRTGKYTNLVINGEEAINRSRKDWKAGNSKQKKKPEGDSNIDSDSYPAPCVDRMKGRHEAAEKGAYRDAECKNQLCHIGRAVEIHAEEPK